MEITKIKKEDAVVLAISGRLDTLSSNSLKIKLEELIRDGSHHILIDFAELSFISSSGLRVLLSAGKELNRLKGKLALCALKDHIKEVFDIAGFTRIFAIYAGQEDALAHL